MATANAPSQTLALAATELAGLLLGTTSVALHDPGNQFVEFDAVIEPRLLRCDAPPPEVWAIDGGQALIADARCLSVVATRTGAVRFVDGRCALEEVGQLRVALLGGETQRVAALAALGVDALSLAGIAADTDVDIHLLRDLGEWEALARVVEAAVPGAIVLVDGDLQPDWRLPRQLVGAILRRAHARGVIVAAVTKHTALARGGAPLLGQLEREAQATLGSTRWWASIGRTRADAGAVRIFAARLDPDARYSFRIDLPATVDPEVALGSLATLCDDAAFPGYPYPLTVADRVAGVPGWEREELRFGLNELLTHAGVPDDVVERAFADRHRLMERS